MGSLTPAEIELIGKLPNDVARGLLWHAEWMDKALDHQLVPAGDWWSLWLLLAGRGAGKTRTSAETIGWWAWSMPGTRWLVSAPTYGDLVGTCFEGESGLLAVIPHELIEPTSSGALYNKTDVELRLKNGSLIKGISAENPERFRGPQFHGGWCLPGDTMIATPTGPRRLDEIRVGDVVCTRFGPRRVLAAGRSNNKNDVVTIECGDTSLTATVDHPILVNDRWVPAGEIVEGDFLCCTASSMTGSPGISVPAGTFTTSGAATCIATSGSKSTEPSLPVTSSITLTATPATTTSSTFSSCASPSTNATTALGAAQAKRTKLQQLLRWTASAFRRAARAFIAQKYSYQSSPAPLAGSVLASAARSGDATSLPPSSVPASCAQLPTSPKSGFNATAARSATTAPPCEPIALKKLAVTSVVRSPNIPTFNLTVEGEHEFIANGVVVHNCDELAAWQRADEAFDMIMFGMRLGDRPRIVISTTPKPKPIITRLIKREGKDVTVSRASTYANLANLAPTFREQILQYEGTALGRQEIHAEVLDPADQGIIKRSWIQLWPADKPLPVFDLIVLSLDTAFTEATRNSKTGDADFTGCSVWGLFREERQDGVLLLDCWQERLGMPDLIERTKREMAVQYGDRDKPLITPIYGAPLLGTSGRKPDLCVIEDKGSGISLRQMLAREGLSAVAYNPGRASKLERLHMVSHLFANGMVWVVESDKRPGQPRSWADPLIEQLCSFSGEKSIAHDDLVDSSTQALRVIVDKMGVSVANPREIDEYWQSSRRRGNPYAA